MISTGARTMQAALELERLTPEKFLARPDHHQFELVNGELEELHMSILSSRVALVIGRILDVHCAANNLGMVFGADLYYRCFPDDPDELRKPDVSFISRNRPERLKPNDGVCRFAPDLAVEVVSKNDLAYEVDAKVQDYRRARIPLIWVVNPESRVIHVYQAGGPNSLLSVGDELRAENVIPGFVCAVADFFPDEFNEH